MTFLTLVIGGLATWRLSKMLVKENGPLMIFARLRAYLATNQTKSGGLFDLISCMACTSMWIGLLAALTVAESLVSFIMYSLAFSAIALLLERLSASKS